MVRQEGTVAQDSNADNNSATNAATATKDEPQNTNNDRTAAAAAPVPDPMEEAKTAAENVRNLKRKVISIAKLTEIFNKKDAELADVKKHLEEAQKKIITLESEATLHAITKADLKHTSAKMAEQIQYAEKLKVEAESFKADHAKHVADLQERALAADSWKVKFEEKQKALEDLKVEHNKVVHRMNGLKNDIITNRGELMKSQAEIGDKRTWLASQKILWEKEEDARFEARTKEHTDRIKELEHQIEDATTEHLVDQSMTQEALKSAQEELAETKAKLEKLDQTVNELRSKNEELERERQAQEDQHQDFDMPGYDEFEEIVPETRGPVSAMPGLVPGPASSSFQSLSAALSGPSKTALAPSMPPAPLVPMSLSSLPTTTATTSNVTSIALTMSPILPGLSDRRLSKSASSSLTTVPVPMTRDVNHLPAKQLEEALRTMEDLKAQFSMLSWVHGTQAGSQRTEALEQRINTLLKEKQALQDQLTQSLVLNQDRRKRSVSFHPDLVSPRSTSGLIRAVSPPPIEIPTSVLASTSAPTSTSSNQVPIAADTVATAETLKKRGRKRKIVESASESEAPTSPISKTFKATTTVGKAKVTQKLFSPEPELDYGHVSDGDETGPSTGAPSSPEKEKRTRAKSPVVKPVVVVKAKRIKKAKQSSSTISLADLEIRNISLNPVPTISDPATYFLNIMESPIIHDSGPFTKLDAMATVLPQNLSALCQAVVKKASGLGNVVTAFRKKRSIMDDDSDDWSLDGYKTMTISSSLCPQEVNIVQLICLLGLANPTMNIPNQVIAFLHDTILRKAGAGEDPQGNRQVQTRVLVRVLVGICRTVNDVNRARVLAYDLLRELDRPKHALILSEAIASIWSDVYKVADDVDVHDPSQTLLKAMQGTLGTMEETPSNDPSLKILYGFDTFTKKCGWPAVESAPFLDELTNEVMDRVRGTDFVEKCKSTPGYEFTTRKTLELLLVHGFDWSEVYNNYFKTDFLAMVLDPSLHKFAIPLIASVTKEPRYSSASEVVDVKDDGPVRQVFEAILASDATLDHQGQSALALIILSNGMLDRLSKTKVWFNTLEPEGKATLPESVRTVLEDSAVA
ncbi:hypothetical protein BGZ83_001188 [Gryganskiella cystojenkinii]|nr:hypothetical protein BGZ83_001188 [Gryganskiella cystojenkinii]